MVWGRVLRLRPSWSRRADTVFLNLRHSCETLKLRMGNKGPGVCSTATNETTCAADALLQFPRGVLSDSAGYLVRMKNRDVLSTLRFGCCVELVQQRQQAEIFKIPQNLFSRSMLHGCRLLTLDLIHARTRQVYDMLGNAWEWVEGGEPTKRTLRGGSFVDYNPRVRDPESEVDPPGGQGPKRPANHAITPGTRMETTQDSGSVNTSFRCASSSTATHTSKSTSDGVDGDRVGPVGSAGDVGGVSGKEGDVNVIEVKRNRGIAATLGEL